MNGRINVHTHSHMSAHAQTVSVGVGVLFSYAAVGAAAARKDATLAGTCLVAVVVLLQAATVAPRA